MSFGRIPRQRGGFLPDPAIRTEGLSRSFGDLTAVDAIDLTVERGEFFGFLGPNGAGKSTTIKMLTGLLAPSAGHIEILGLDLGQDPVGVKSQIGVVPEGLALFERLTGAQYLSFVGCMYGLDETTAVRRAGELLEVLDLVDLLGEGRHREELAWLTDSST